MVARRKKQCYSMKVLGRVVPIPTASLHAHGPDCRVGHYLTRSWVHKNVRKSKCMCAKQFPSAHQDAVKGTKVARYMLKTMKMRDLRAVHASS
jgi:hypothetical protein